MPLNSHLPWHTGIQLPLSRFTLEYALNFIVFYSEKHISCPVASYCLYLMFFHYKHPEYKKLDSTPAPLQHIQFKYSNSLLQMLKKKHNITENTSKVITLVNFKHSISHQYTHSCIQIGKKKLMWNYYSCFFSNFWKESSNPMKPFCFRRLGQKIGKSVYCFVFCLFFSSAEKNKQKKHVSSILPIVYTTLSLKMTFRTA